MGQAVEDLAMKEATPCLCLSWAGELWSITFLLYLTRDLCNVVKSPGTGFCMQLDANSHTFPSLGHT